MPTTGRTGQCPSREISGTAQLDEAAPARTPSTHDGRPHTGADPRPRIPIVAEAVARPGVPEVLTEPVAPDRRPDARLDSAQPRSSACPARRSHRVPVPPYAIFANHRCVVTTFVPQVGEVSGTAPGPVRSAAAGLVVPVCSPVVPAGAVVPRWAIVTA